MRLTAEDPAHDYLPSTGTFGQFVIDADGVRVDTGIESGSTVSPYYDSMVAKVIAHGPTRAAAVRQLRRALADARLHGPVTNRDQLVRILDDPAFQAGDLHTGFLDDDRRAEPITGDRTAALAALVVAEVADRRAQARVLAGIPAGWRNNPSVDQRIDVIDGDDDQPLAVTYRLDRNGSIAHLTVGDDARRAHVTAVAGPTEVDLAIDGVTGRYHVGRDGHDRVIDAPDGHRRVQVLPRHPDPDSAAAAGSLAAPMPGAVVRVLAAVGDTVAAGTPLVVIEAMKMEHQISSPADGRLAEVLVAVGEQVETGKILLVLEPLE